MRHVWGNCSGQWCDSSSLDVSPLVSAETTPGVMRTTRNSVLSADHSASFRGESTVAEQLPYAQIAASFTMTRVLTGRQGDFSRARSFWFEAGWQDRWMTTPVAFTWSPSAALPFSLPCCPRRHACAVRCCVLPR